MNTFGPVSTLSFEQLLHEVGPAQKSKIPEVEKYRRERQVTAMARASELYHMTNLREHCPQTIISEFVSCFGESQQAKLLRPFQNQWRAGRWSDSYFGALFLTLYKSGDTTSLLLMEYSVDEVVALFRELPEEVMLTPSEQRWLKNQSGLLTIYRGGWSFSEEALVERGVSWTIDKEIAEQFVTHNMGHRFKDFMAFHLQAEVSAENVVAYFEHESEVVVHPKSVQNVRSLITPRVAKLRDIGKNR